jgi:hypothetical protein
MPQVAAVVRLDETGLTLRLSRAWRDATPTLVESIANQRRKDLSSIERDFLRQASTSEAKRACIGFYPAHAYDIFVPTATGDNDAWQVGDLVPIRVESRLYVADGHEGTATYTPDVVWPSGLDAFYAIRTYALPFRIGVGDSPKGTALVLVPFAVAGAAIFADGQCRPLPPPPSPPPSWVPNDYQWTGRPFLVQSMVLARPQPPQLMAPERPLASFNTEYDAVKRENALLRAQLAAATANAANATSVSPLTTSPPLATAAAAAAAAPLATAAAAAAATSSESNPSSAKQLQVELKNLARYAAEIQRLKQILTPDSCSARPRYVGE